MIPEQKEISNEIISIPRRFSISYKIIGILFAIIAFLIFFRFTLSPLDVNTFIQILYAIITIVMALGFFKMRKWLVTLLGVVVISMVIKVILVIFQGKFTASGAVLFFIFIPLFFFAYLTRPYLKGGYKKTRIAILFILLLAFSQVIMYLSK